MHKNLFSSIKPILLNEFNLWMIGIFLIFSQSIFWILQFWFSDSWNLYGLVMFLFFVILLVKDFKKKIFTFQITNLQIIGLVVFSIVYFLSRQVIRIEIISALIFISYLVFVLINSNKSKNIWSVINLSGLAFLSLPLHFYVNSLFGYYIRLAFAQSIHWVQSLLFGGAISINDTTIFNGNLYINIDSGCSGTYNLYLLTGFVFFICGIRKSGPVHTILVLIASLLFYLILNWVHLFSMVYLHNFREILNIRSSHEFFALIVSIVSFGFAYLLCNLTRKHIEKIKTTKLKTQLTISKRLLSIIFSVLIFTSFIQLGYSFRNQNELMLKEKKLSVTCESKYEGNLLEKSIKDKLTQIGVYEVVSFNDKNLEIISGRTYGNKLLTNISTVFSDETRKVKFIRSVPINQNEFIREVTYTDNTYAYFYLFQNNNYILEYNPLENLSNNSESIFVLIGSENRINSTNTDLLTYFQCI